MPFSCITETLYTLTIFSSYRPLIYLLLWSVCRSHLLSVYWVFFLLITSRRLLYIVDTGPLIFAFWIFSNLWLAFIFLYWYFWQRKICNFYKVKFISLIMFFMQIIILQIFSVMFSSRSILDFTFTLMSMINLEVNFQYGVRLRLKLSFFYYYCGYLILSSPCVEKSILSPLNFLSQLFEKSIDYKHEIISFLHYVTVLIF